MNLKPCANQLIGLQRVAAGRQTTGGRRIDVANGVRAATSASRNARDVFSGTIQVRISHSSTGGSPALEREVRLGAFNLLEVGNASIGLGGRTGTHEVGNRNRSQEADDGHHDHDFNECEAGLTERIDLHNCFCLSLAV